jgi:elongation factor P
MSGPRRRATATAAASLPGGVVTARSDVVTSSALSAFRRGDAPGTMEPAVHLVDGPRPPAGNRHADGIVAGSEMQCPRLARAGPHVNAGRNSVKVIASTLRKGNVVEKDGKLYVILFAENIHPGKGTPVTQLDMRRITDGVKVSERYRTTEQVERAFVEDREHTFLYSDGEGFHFMNPENYEQVAVPEDVVGDAAPYLQEGMAVMLSIHNGVPLTIELPQRVTLEVAETEPVLKGQTASSSYKPATLSNGVRTTVPPHIAAGTRVVVMTADGSYVERAKD